MGCHIREKEFIILESDKIQLGLPDLQSLCRGENQKPSYSHSGRVSGPGRDKAGGENELDKIYFIVPQVR
jgi:hypothetical protein